MFEGVLAGFSPDFSRALTRFFVCVLGDFEGFWGCLSNFRSCLGVIKDIFMSFLVVFEGFQRYLSGFFCDIGVIFERFWGGEGGFLLVFVWILWALNLDFHGVGGILVRACWSQ